MSDTITDYYCSAEKRSCVRDPNFDFGVEFDETPKNNLEQQVTSSPNGVEKFISNCNVLF